MYPNNADHKPFLNHRKMHKVELLQETTSIYHPPPREGGFITISVIKNDFSRSIFWLDLRGKKKKSLGWQESQRCMLSHFLSCVRKQMQSVVVQLLTQTHNAFCHVLADSVRPQLWEQRAAEKPDCLLGRNRWRDLRQKPRPTPPPPGPPDKLLHLPLCKSWLNIFHLQHCNLFPLEKTKKKTQPDLSRQEGNWSFTFVYSPQENRAAVGSQCHPVT